MIPGVPAATAENTVRSGSREASLQGRVSVRNMVTCNGHSGPVWSILLITRCLKDRRRAPPALPCQGAVVDSASSLCVAMAVLLTFVIVIIVGALVLVGLFHYRKTGSLLPTLPKLPRSVLLGGV